MFYRVTRLMRRFYLAASELHWSVLLAIVLVHMGISYLLMRIAGEADLQPLAAYIYWYVTTALTVGYGDLSPKSDMGRLLASFWVMPGAIACFTAALAKTLDGVASVWRQKRFGRGDYSEMKNAIVLIGYDKDRTPRMIDEIVADTAGAAEIVLYTRQQLDNSDPRYRYVHATSLTSTADMERAGIPKAQKIVIFTASDETALAAALAVTAVNDHAHVVAYFNERSNAALLHSHCPRVETVLTPSVELVVKALSDPGSSQLLTELASATDDGATLYAAHTPDAGRFEDIAAKLRPHQAVLVAFERAGVRDVHFDFEGDIAAGDKIFYIASKRLPPAWA
jgi:voltage-gated potassium channel